MSLDSIKKEAQETGVSLSLVLKEYIHGIVLDYLFRKGLFSHLVFQGGTALRLFYGGIRYSEDLDFVLKKKDERYLGEIHGYLRLLPKHVEKTALFVKSARLTEQKKSSTFLRFHLLLEIPDLNITDRTNIEVANVPSYSHEALILKRSTGPFSPAVVVEKPQEILCDKIIAFGNREYLKGRDIWDIKFLFTTLKCEIDAQTIEWVQKKLNDYKIKNEKFILKYQENLKILNEQGLKLFRNELDVFLPQPYRETFSPQYGQICRYVSEKLNYFMGLYKNEDK